MRTDSYPRPGLSFWKMSNESYSIGHVCEHVDSGCEFVGFSMRGRPLIETDNLDKCISVPDVAFVRIRDLSRHNGYRFHRVLVKMFKTGS